MQYDSIPVVVADAPLSIPEHNACELRKALDGLIRKRRRDGSEPDLLVLTRAEAAALGLLA